MTSHIQIGPKDDQRLPYQSLGVTFYNELRRQDQDQVILIDQSTQERISYGKLRQTSTRLALALRKIGVKPGDVVMIIAPNCWEYVASVLASFFIGAAVNLLNHDYTLEEMRHLFDICHPHTVFCTAKTVNTVLKLEQPSIRNLVLYDSDFVPGTTSFDSLLTEEGALQPTPLDPAETVALILTSSGTTGLPKCVLITHANFRVTLLNTEDPSLMGVTRGETIIGYLPFFHVFGTLVLLTSVLSGARMIIMRKFLPEHFLHTIQHYKISKLFAVKPILLFLVQSPLVSRYDLTSIRDVVSGSSVISPELEQTVAKKLGIESVRQAYGTTEVTGAATVVPRESLKYGSIGKVTRTFQIKVCDPGSGRTLPPFRVGELRIWGPGVTMGYLGNQKETQQSFDETGFIKTGDLGYYDEEGFFFITDRIKDIIKCKGFQISPVELENVLIKHPKVKDVGVVGVADERAGEVPLAFVVKEPNRDVSEEELVRFVEENISIQKRLFGGVRFVEEIPKNPSGKILRRQLRDLLRNESTYL